MGLVDHADRELRAFGYTPDAEVPNNWIYENVIELVKVFAEQGHSGHSAAFVRQIFHKLADYQPLGPLTGEDSEWNAVGHGVHQNKRCSRVFKSAEGAYDIEGKVFREPNGACYTNRDSHTPVTFPYTPTTVYVDVPSSREE